jgi:transposase-like protein
MPRSILDQPRFKNETAAYAYVESVVWPNGRACPHCGVIDQSGALKGKSTRIGVYKCYACRKPFTVKVGTIFEKSHVPLHIWLQAMHLMCSSKKGFSANQFCRVLGVDFKTGWFIGHRIREAMMPGEGGFGPLGGEGKIVESDETYTVYKEGGPTWILHPEHGWQKRRSGADLAAATLRGVVFGAADTKSRLMTDELRAYRRIGQRFAGHDAVNHGQEEWARKLGDGTKAHTNTVEGFFSILKRGIYGCYFHVSEAHLHRYLAEFDFRYNNRIALGIDDEQRTENAVRGIIGKRLTYRTTNRKAVAPRSS